MNSNALRNSSHTAAKSWVDWTNLTLGVLLVISPWAALGGNAVIAWNAVICGSVIACVAGIALAKPTSGAEKTNVCLGLWLLIAPWALAFSDHAGAMWTSVFVGLGVACFAGLQLSMLKRPAQA